MSASKKHSQVVVLPRPEAPAVVTPRIGTLVAWTREHGPVIDYPGNLAGPLRARSLVAFDAERVRMALQSGAEVLLSFEESRADRPILIGFVEPAGGPAPAQELSVEAKLDGRRVVLAAQDEIVLQCGQASITLRRNGRIVIKGSYVEACAEGVNRIKGGTVRIN